MLTKLKAQDVHIKIDLNSTQKMKEFTIPHPYYI